MGWSYEEATGQPDAAAAAPPAGGGSFSFDDLNASGEGTVSQAVGTGALEGVPYARQAVSAVLPAIKKGLSYLPMSDEQKRALAAQPDTSEAANARIRAASEEAATAHPFVQGATSLATGAALLPVAGAGEAIGAGAARLAPSAARIAPYLGDAAVGAGLGAAYGASGGEGWFDPRGAGYGAIGGGVLGAAARPIASAVENVGRGVSNWAGLYNPDAEAAAKLGQAYAQDQATGGGAMTRGEFGVATREGQPVVAGDMGGAAVRGLARAAANASPEARGILGNALGQRYLDQQSRFGSYIDNLFPGQNLDTQLQRDTIRSQAKTANGPAYQAAFNDPNAGAVWSPQLANLMRSPDVQRAIGVAQDKAANFAVQNRMPIPQNPFVKDAAGNWSLRTDAQGNAVGIPSLRFWDQVKQSLDGMAGVAMRAGNKPQANDLTSITGMLRNELDAKVPAYANARGSAARFFGNEDAVDGAVAYDKATSEPAVRQSLQQLQGLDPEDREIFARAYGAQLKQRAMRPSQNADLSRQFSNPLMQAKMNAALNTASNPGRSSDLEAFIRRENMMNMLKQSVLGNSTTSQQLSDLSAQGHGGGLGHMIAGSFGSTGAGAFTGALAGAHESQGEPIEERAKSILRWAAAGAGAGFIGGRRTTASEGMFRSLAEKIASSDPNVYNQALQQAARTPGMMDALRRAEMAAAGQAGVGAAQTIGNVTGLSQ